MRFFSAMKNGYGRNSAGKALMARSNQKLAQHCVVEDLAPSAQVSEMATALRLRAAVWIDPPVHNFVPID